MAARPVDYLIVGQGLAGSTLARALLNRGRTVSVIDRENPASASRVAAGLINPVTGKKLTKTWRADELLPFARDYYQSWESELGGRFYADKTIWRFFQSDREEEIWETRRSDAGLASFIGALPGDLSRVPGLRPQRGGFQITRAGHLDTCGLLAAFRSWLGARGALIDERFSLSDLKIEPDRVEWRGVTAKRLVFCEGHAASQNPLFSWIPFRHAKGAVLTVRGPSLPESIVLNRGKWLLPVGDGLFRAGATYEWSDLSEEPTPGGREEILNTMGKLVSWSPEVIGHQAGVRPIVKDTRLVAGLHPAHPSIGIFNGLASKGILWAPFFAEQLAEHMEKGGPLDPEIDVRRNL